MFFIARFVVAMTYLCGSCVFTMHKGSYIQRLSISQISAMKANGVWDQSSPIHTSRLRVVYFSYVNFNGETKHDGSITVMDVVAKDVQRIFQDLFRQRFPLTQAIPIEHYKGDDNASMAANNSVAYNDRRIAHSKNISIHAYGLAIDINPQQNPFIDNTRRDKESTILVYPESGKKYLNRLNVRPGMITQEIVQIFSVHGFKEWGGMWNKPIDWHHFQYPRVVCELLKEMSYQHGRKFIKIYKACNSPILLTHSWIAFKKDFPISRHYIPYYKKNPSLFMKKIQVALCKGDLKTSLDSLKSTIE